MMGTCWICEGTGEDGVCHECLDEYIEGREDIKAMRAALDSLPKIGQLVGEGDERKIVRDVVVTPETRTVWIVSDMPYLNEPSRPEPELVNVESIRRGGIELSNTRHYKIASRTGGQCYNSQAAAEFAIEKARTA